eukprot:scaffold13282_cov71-Phaeocystis_antarctica.AAC.2
MTAYLPQRVFTARPSGTEASDARAVALLGCPPVPFGRLAGAGRFYAVAASGQRVAARPRGQNGNLWPGARSRRANISFLTNATIRPNVYPNARRKYMRHGPTLSACYLHVSRCAYSARVWVYSTH